MYPRIKVAPFVGAWIEIPNPRGEYDNAAVAPFVGAWIEIDVQHEGYILCPGRSLRGSVD